MQLIITIPDNVKDRVINGLSLKGGYPATINGQPNPETATQFCKAMVIRQIKKWVKQAEDDAMANQPSDLNIT